MGIIEKLYDSSIQEEISLRYGYQLDKEISKIAKKICPNTQKEITKELLFEASGCGQFFGFITGFKFAVTLMAEGLE